MFLIADAVHFNVRTRALVNSRHRDTMKVFFALSSILLATAVTSAAAGTEDNFEMDVVSSCLDDISCAESDWFLTRRMFPIL